MNSKNLHLHALPIVSLTFAGLVFSLVVGGLYVDNSYISDQAKIAAGGLAGISQTNAPQPTDANSNEIIKIINGRIQAKSITSQISNDLATSPTY